VIWVSVRDFIRTSSNELQQQAGHMDASTQPSEWISALDREGHPHMVPSTVVLQGLALVAGHLREGPVRRGLI
jgi:hypothetical protein